jgi:hypothetical protein
MVDLVRLQDLCEGCLFQFADSPAVAQIDTLKMMLWPSYRSTYYCWYRYVTSRFVDRVEQYIYFTEGRTVVVPIGCMDAPYIGQY